MTPAWIVSLVVLLSIVGLGGYRFGADSTEVTCQKHDEAQQQVTILAQKHVITEVQTQGKITEGAEHEYDSDTAAISTLYGDSGVQPDPAATVKHLPAIPNPACRALPPQNSRKFGLTPQACDIEEQKLISLWGWIKAQQAVQ